MNRILALPLVGTLLLAAGCASGGGASASAPLDAADVTAALGTEVRDTSGAPHRLDADLARGRPVALVFWQPWCGSCLAEVPTVVAAQQRFGDEMSFYGVVSGPDGSVDEQEVARAMLDTGMTYPALRDTELVLTRAFGVTRTPTVVIVDPDGGIVYREHAAPAEWHGE